MKPEAGHQLHKFTKIICVLFLIDVSLLLDACKGLHDIRNNLWDMRFANIWGCAFRPQEVTLTECAELFRHLSWLPSATLSATVWLGGAILLLVIWGWFVGQQMNKRIKALEETIATLRGDTI